MCSDLARKGPQCRAAHSASIQSHFAWRKSRFALRDWVNGGFVQVDQYEMTFSEDTHTATIDDAARFVRAADGRIEMEIKQIVILPFTLNGFHTLFNQVEIAVR